MASAAILSGPAVEEAAAAAANPLLTWLHGQKSPTVQGPADLLDIVGRWATRSELFDVSRMYEGPDDFVLSGFIRNKAAMDSFLAFGVSWFGECSYQMRLLTLEEALGFFPIPDVTVSCREVSSDSEASTDSEMATETASQKRKASPRGPKSAARKASRKAAKKRAWQRKRTTSSSSSNKQSIDLGSPQTSALQIPDIATDDRALAQARARPSTPTPSPAKQSKTNRALTEVRAPVRPITVAQAEPQPTTDAQPEPEPTTAAQLQPEPIAAVQPRRRIKKQKFLAIDLSKIDIPVSERPLRDTYLIRPVDPAQSLQTLSPVKLGRFLEVIGRVLEIRNIRCGGLAIDFEPGSVDESTALTIPAILDITVTISRPFGTAAATTASGILSGVHPELTEEEILSDIKSDVPVTAVKRLAKPGTTSWVVKLTFAGLTTPTDVRLFARLHKVKPYVDRPMMCGNCSRFGHPARVCRSTARCRSCGEPHETTTCPTPAAALCCNCGGPHPADSPACPNRAFQVKVMEVKKEQGITFREARKTVTTATRSYAAALKQQQPNAELPRQPAPATAAPAAANQTVPVQALADLFQSVLTVLMEAAVKQDFSAVVVQVAALFKGFAAPRV